MNVFKVACNCNAALLVVRTAANISAIASIPGALLPLMFMLSLLLMLTLLWSVALREPLTFVMFSAAVVVLTATMSEFIYRSFSSLKQAENAHF